MIRGSAVNQDGASNGLTAPNGPAQQRVITQALANARLTPADIDAVEAHGTGTTLGDPIEAQAILATYGQDRDTPLWLGSIKSNIGHTQAAAGVAGIIKMLMAIRHHQLPHTLHIDEPSSHVDWTGGHVALLTRPQPWAPGNRPRRAGISSFGISGTNAHLILEEPPTPDHTPDHTPDRATSAAVGVVDGPVLLPVSGKTPEAVRDYARRLHEHLTHRPDLDPHQVAHTLAGRTHFEHRAVITAEQLPDLAAGHLPITHTTTRGRTAFLYPGQGAQHPGMGHHLYEQHPVFADTINTLSAHLRLDLPALMWGARTHELHHTLHTQPVLFAYETALHQLLTHHGVTPHYLTGHSIGEITAAHTSGALSLPDACTLITARARLMNTLPPGGAMLAAHTDTTTITPYLDTTTETTNEPLTIAAVNSPTSLVLAGTTTAIDHINTQLTTNGIHTQRLHVSHAFHSPLMDPILEPFHTAIANIRHQQPHTPLISTLTGQPLTTITTDHWTRQLRHTVDFTQAITTLEQHGITHYIEIGPHPTLTPHITTTPTTPTQNKNQHIPLTHTLTTIHNHGTPINWHTLHNHHQHTPLPTYPFQHKPYWVMPRATAAPATGHAVLSTHTTLAETGMHGALTGRVSRTTPPLGIDARDRWNGATARHGFRRPRAVRGGPGGWLDAGGTHPPGPARAPSVGGGHAAGHGRAGGRGRAVPGRSALTVGHGPHRRVDATRDRLPRAGRSGPGSPAAGRGRRGRHGSGGRVRTTPAARIRLRADFPRAAVAAAAGGRSHGRGPPAGGHRGHGPHPAPGTARRGTAPPRARRRTALFAPVVAVIAPLNVMILAMPVSLFCTRMPLSTAPVALMTLAESKMTVPFAPRPSMSTVRSASVLVMSTLFRLMVPVRRLVPLFAT